MGPLSLDVRVRIVEAYQCGEGSVREVAERFKVTPKTVQTYRKLWKMTGSIQPRPHGGGRGRKIDDALLRQLLEEKGRRGRTIGRSINWPPSTPTSTAASEWRAPP